MPDSKITALTSIGTSTDPANDPLVLVDVSDTSMAATGTTKKVTLNQLLATSPTATLASATITGDLTVDTSTLYVSSSTDKVGIGTTSLSSEKLTVAGNVSANAWIGRGNIAAPSGDCSIFRSADNTLSFGIASTTAMTLNSTGLGVGAGPASKLYVYGANVSGIGQFRIDCPAAGVAQQTFAINGVGQGNIYHDGSQFVIGSVTSTPLFLRTANTVAVTIDASQNVGIGVTPSATNSTYFQALEIARVGQGLTAAKNVLTGSPSSWLSNNSYATYSSGVVWNYAISQPAAQYRLFEGQHQWFNAPSGTAGNAITFTQAMTLDASGNLLVAATSSSLTTGTGFKVLSNSGTTLVGTVGASSSDVDTTYRLYSSTASAYRFYVGYGGTVYATNTTISAISDARLKENVQDIDVGLGAILALKPRKFDWKTGKGKDIKGDRGFIAQEFETVFPQLVDEWADPAPEGEAPYKSVRQDLIPVLVKAIQELTARVQTLETR